MRREIKISWEGQEIAIPNTMALSNKIEMSGINIFWLYQQLCLPQYPPTTITAVFLSMLLNEGGKKVEADDVLKAIIDSDQTVYLVRAALECCEQLIPALDSGGKK